MKAILNAIKQFFIKWYLGKITDILLSTVFSGFILAISMIAYNVSDSISPPNNLTIVANNVFQVLGYISAISGVIDIVVLATKLINAFCNWIKKFLNK